MTETTNRRDFMKHAGIATFSAAALSSFSVKTQPVQAAESAAHGIKKAVKIGMVQEGETFLDKFKLVKSLGFDGIELAAPTNWNKEEILAAKEETGLPIHGVVGTKHWKQTLSHNDPAMRKEGLEALLEGIRDAKEYGASSILLVVGKVDKETSYDDAYTRTQAEIRKAIPLAEELGIKILFENVWNNFLLSPLEMARYIDEFETDAVGAYFDVGNVVRYGWPEQWIRILGDRIVKLDIKEYSRKKQMEEGLYKGFQVKLGEGDCDWAAVMKALRDINYTGWGTAEVRGGDKTRLKEIADRMDKCFAS